MSDAACAEEEEGLRRVIATAAQTLETVRRIERGEIEVARENIEGSRNSVLRALDLLQKADSMLWRSITACKGCPE